MSEGGVRTRTRAELPRRGSSMSARTGTPAHDASAFSRALALRLVFDTGAVAVLDGYRRRVKAVSMSLRRRGHRRLGALVCDENVARLAAVTCLATAATALYVSRNRGRWAREREMRQRRAVLRSQLKKATCYEEFIVVAHRMERLEERFATEPESFLEDSRDSVERVVRVNDNSEDPTDDVEGHERDDKENSAEGFFGLKSLWTRFASVSRSLRSCSESENDDDDDAKDDHRALFY